MQSLVKLGCWLELHIAQSEWAGLWHYLLGMHRAQLGESMGILA